MTGTRARTVRAAIVTAITRAITDDPAHPGDRLTHIDGGADSMTAAPDRAFEVRLAAAPERIPASSCDYFQVQYACRIFYAASQDGIDDRMSDDFERLYVELDRLHEDNIWIDACDVTPTDVSDAGAAEVVTLGFSVVCKYRLASNVVLKTS